ncbi:hypothetical protein AKJ16_DCAP08562 [Drosera capensis]
MLARTKAATDTLKLWLFVRRFELLCFVSQRGLVHSFSSVSMRLRPKRTFCGVKCFGDSHTNLFSSLYLFFRETLTCYNL